MTRILVQRGSASSSSSRASQSPATQSPSSSKDEEQERETRQESVLPRDFPPEQSTISENNASKTAESPQEIKIDETGTEKGKSREESPESIVASKEVKNVQDTEILGTSSAQIVSAGSFPPPPPVPPPKPSKFGVGLRTFPLGQSFGRTGSSCRPQSWPLGSSRNSTSDLHPSSPRSYGDAEGYNSADEQKPRYGPSYDNERERHFELDIRRSKGYEVKRMMDDGNCLFRAVADQVYGDPEAFDMVRQMCIDYMERERDHFSQFITEGFTSYCKRKRRDKALLAEGRFYSDLELTEKEIERMVMEASRAEYMANNDDKLKMQMGFRESTPGAEPSSSAATTKADIMGSNCVRTLMAMGFGYLQVMEAHGIFGDDVDAILCFLLETDGHSGASQGKGKAAK